MKILVADKISSQGVEFLRQQPDFEVVEAYGSSPEKVLELSKDAAAIIVRSETKITKEVFAAAKNLKAVGRAGVGVDNIDVDSASSRGVVVMNTPSGNTIATAELTFTHMLLSARPVAQASASMRDGKWDRKSYSGYELMGKTLGVLGMGRIGTEVAKRAQAFGMKVLGYDPFLTEERAKGLGLEKVELERIFAESDFITSHMPLTESTKYMIDEKSIEKMKKGVHLINCARGGIIKESALIAALDSGKVATVNLDVFEEEPLAADSPLRKHPKVVLTPHLGASTAEAQESVGIEIAEAICDYLKKGEVRNAVNMPSVDARTLHTLMPYFRLADKLGQMISQLTPDEVRKLKISYFGRIAELPATPVTRAIQKGYLLPICGDEVNDVNAPSKMKGLGIEVETVKNNTSAEYSDLIRVEAEDSKGVYYCVTGTLVSKLMNPKVVSINGNALEVTPDGIFLVLENKDVPGIVGMMGMALAQDNVNIANMCLSREGKSTAMSVYQLDSMPSDSAIESIRKNPNILKLTIVKL